MYRHERSPDFNNNSSVVIYPEAVQAVGSTDAELLRTTPLVNVTGAPLQRGNPRTYGQAGMHTELPVIATSLRWQDGASDLPDEIAEGYPLLTVYDMDRHIYIGYIALPSFDFKISPRHRVRQAMFTG